MPPRRRTTETEADPTTNPRNLPTTADGFIQLMNRNSDDPIRTGDRLFWETGLNTMEASAYMGSSYMQPLIVAQESLDMRVQTQYPNPNRRPIIGSELRANQINFQRLARAVQQGQQRARFRTP